MLFLVYITLTFLAFLMPKSKKITILIWFFLWLMYALPSYVGDLEVYEWVYTNFDSGNFYFAYEPGFIITYWIGNALGFSFIQYRLMVGLIVCAIPCFVILEQTESSAFASILYATFPFFVWVNVMRSGIASVFILLAFNTLVKGKKCRKRKVFFFITIAFLFHYSSIIFYSILFLDKILKRRYIIMIEIMTVLLVFIVFFTNILYQVVDYFTDNQKILQWFMKNEATANLNGAIACVVLILSMYMLLNNNLKKWYQFNKISIGKLEVYNLIKLSYQLSLLMIILIPLLILSSPFMRIPYMIMEIVITSTLCIDELSQKKKECIILNKIYFRYKWIALYIIILAWKTYYMLPYMKEGENLFFEYFK